ncbi:hypothetical protein [Brevundimonas vesicularis]|uniref:Uncharacterized protein n=1 Tax=Brevundimonas vesicularis TaxID=41276 RepID=A0A1Z3U587_BREVE|nr:hypothetical protein [Brevundimonas vesicularis]ASE38411.1 hypothetical protein CEP68_02205 [Brevundimonas vesicularis]
MNPPSPRRSTPALQSLPPQIYAGIGEVIFRFTVLEGQLRDLVYILAGLDRQIGRLVVRDTNVPELWKLSKELMNIRQIKIAAVDRIDHKDLISVTAFRNRMAHSKWGADAQTRLTYAELKGSWQPDGDGVKYTRSARPEGRYLSRDEIPNSVALIHQLEMAVDAVAAETLAALGKTPADLRPADAPFAPHSGPVDQTPG